MAVAGTTVRAQSDPRQILRGMITQAQTGTPNPTWYGTELWQTIAIQTGYTGLYPQLVQLGPVRNVTISQQVPLPTGVIYAGTAQHARGTSYWEFGISTLTNRIEYASFQAAPGSTGTGTIGLPEAEPDDEPEPVVKKPTPSGKGTPTSGTGGTSDACRRFPNLC
jgi:hypothetical protein